MSALARMLLVGAIAVTACRPKSKASVVEVEDAGASVPVDATPLTGCIGGPSSADDQARWKKITSERNRSAEASLPLSTLANESTDAELFHEISARLQDKEIHRGVASMSRAERTIHLVYWLATEVRNGGFHQYLSNSSGNCAQAAVGAVHDLAYPELEALYARVIAKFPGGPPPEDRQAREEALKRASVTTWEAESTAFDALDTMGALRRYARAHLSELDLPPRR